MLWEGCRPVKGWRSPISPKREPARMRDRPFVPAGHEHFWSLTQYFRRICFRKRTWYIRTYYEDMRQVPRHNVTGTSGGFGRRVGDHGVCLFELWSSESGGPGTSPHHGSALSCLPSGNRHSWIRGPGRLQAVRGARFCAILLAMAVVSECRARPSCRRGPEAGGRPNRPRAAPRGRTCRDCWHDG